MGNLSTKCYVLNCTQEASALVVILIGGKLGEEQSHLLDVVSRLGAGLDEHDAQLFGPLLALLDRDLPAKHRTE